MNQNETEFAIFPAHKRPAALPHLPMPALHTAN